jgi:O-succinylbenzoic acid--CoA ligase
MKRHHFDDWTVVLVGGAHSDSLPHNAISTYGLTETGGGVVYDGMGLPDVEWRICDDEIFLRTPSMARTYRAASLPLRDGWLATGDLGRVSGDRLHVEGRRDDLIITGGNKVWPHTVEERLRGHPMVADVAVRAVADEEWGSLVCAWVVPSDPAHMPTLDELRAHVKDTMAEYCAPRALVRLTEIPRSALGKVRMAELPRP